MPVRMYILYLIQKIIHYGFYWGCLGVGGVALGVAAVMALFGFLMLLFAGVAGLAMVLPLWAAFLIVAGVLLLIAAIAGLVGKGRLSKSKQYTVDPKAGMNRSVDAVRKGLQK